MGGASMWDGTDINLFAVVVSAMASMGIGMFWYSPRVFGKRWMNLMGIGAEEMNRIKKTSRMARSYALALLSSLAMSFVLAYLIYWTAATTIPLALFTGFLSWLGFIATVLLGSVLWEHRPWGIYMINAGHYLAVCLTTSLILVLFQ